MLQRFLAHERPCLLQSKRQVYGLALLASVPLCAACSDPLPLGENVHSVRYAVSAAEVDELNGWAGVVYLRTPVADRIQLCTGTLIAPNLVITAMHCVAPLNDWGFECKYNGEVVQDKPGAGELGTPVDANVIEIRTGFDAPGTVIAAHGKQLITTQSPTICTNDLALVILDQDLELPLSALRLDQATGMGEPLTVVGYGATGVSGDATARRYRSNVRVVDVGAETGSAARSGAPPRTVVLESSACEGDSGGPTFSQGDYPTVVGVNSIIIGVCNTTSSRSIYTRIAPFKSLILDAFDQAGHSPWEPVNSSTSSTQSGAASAADAAAADPAATSGSTQSSGQGDTRDESTLEPSTSTARRLTTGCGVGVQTGDAGNIKTSLELLFGLLVLVVRRRR